MSKKSASAVLLVEPLVFGYNKEEAAFRPLAVVPAESEDISKHARNELLTLHKTLLHKGVKSILVQDDEFQHTPSSVFASSWISFQPDSRIVAFPIAAQNRKPERRGNILNIVVDNGFPIYDIVDISTWENEGKFLYGTESLVLHHASRTAFCAVSQMADREVLADFCAKTGYKPVAFSVVEGNVPTNQLLMLADGYAVVCWEMIAGQDREALKNTLLQMVETLVEVTTEQAQRFATSAVQLQTDKGDAFLLISDGAWQSLSEEQRILLAARNEVVTADISTIERVGGASISAVVAPIYLPQ